MSNGTIWVLHWGSDRWWFHYDDVDTVAPLSLSLYEGAAFKLLFPIGIQWSLVPPADSWGMRFLYRSVWSHFAFFGLAWMCSYSSSYSVVSLIPNAMKFGSVFTRSFGWSVFCSIMLGSFKAWCLPKNLTQIWIWHILLRWFNWAKTWFQNACLDL